jgi:hypothetical protein
MCGRAPSAQGRNDADEPLGRVQTGYVTRRAWPLALMRSADRIPINFASSELCPVFGLSQSSVTTECASASSHPPAIKPSPLCGGDARWCSGGSRRRWSPIILLPHHDRPGDPRHLVGQRQRDQPERTAIQQRRDPCRMPVCFAWQSAHNRGRANGEQASQITVALLGHAPELLFAPA